MFKKTCAAVLFSIGTLFAVQGYAAELVQADDALHAQAAQAAQEQVNLNTADVASLQASLNGVGQTKAQAIVQYRDAHGPFATVDELLEVKGIGPAILERNRHLLTAE